MDTGDHYRQTFEDLNITVVVRYVGIHPLGKMYQWDTQIVGVEKSPKAFYRPIDEKKPSMSQVALHIANWYKNPLH